MRAKDAAEMEAAKAEVQAAQSEAAAAKEKVSELSSTLEANKTAASEREAALTSV